MTTIEIKDLEIVTENTCKTVEPKETSLVIGACGGMTGGLGFVTLDSVACCLVMM
ncbi:MAG: hypothetical protein QNJ33_03305 [Crocosphaera sp.]|nr:hypothetical protein [Crocosphaera sp.]